MVSRFSLLGTAHVAPKRALGPARERSSNRASQLGRAGLAREFHPASARLARDQQGSLAPLLISPQNLFSFFPRPPPPAGRLRPWPAPARRRPPPPPPLAAPVQRRRPPPPPLAAAARGRPPPPISSMLTLTVASFGRRLLRPWPPLDEHGTDSSTPAPPLGVSMNTTTISPQSLRPPSCAARPPPSAATTPSHGRQDAPPPHAAGRAARTPPTATRCIARCIASTRT
jgi:hypothetical protein